MLAEASARPNTQHFPADPPVYLSVKGPLPVFLSPVHAPQLAEPSVGLGVVVV